MDLELPRDFKELFALLNANNVEYLLIGGYAVGVYGYSRSTSDIDIFISDERDNVRRLAVALEKFGVHSDNTADLFPRERSLLELGVEPMKVQFMNFADGVKFDEAFAAMNVVQIEDVFVFIISKADLIKNKLATGRHKDLADIERLEKIHSADE